MFATRVLTALIILPITLAALWWGGVTGRLFLALVVVGFCAWEAAAVFGRFTARWTTLLTTAACLPSVGIAFGGWFEAIALGGCVGMLAAAGLLCTLAVYVVEVPDHEFDYRANLPQAALAVLYPGIFLASLVAGVLVLNREQLVWYLGVIVCADSFAYLGGKGLGPLVTKFTKETPRKLAPRLSPGKTVLGVYCGLIAAVLWSVWAGNYLGLTSSLVLPALCGLLLAVAAIAGDLVESLMKRTFEVKDMGSILPGHGGVLDRVDALIFGMPLMLLVAKVL